MNKPSEKQVVRSHRTIRKQIAMLDRESLSTPTKQQNRVNSVRSLVNQLSSPCKAARDSKAGVRYLGRLKKLHRHLGPIVVGDAAALTALQDIAAPLEFCLSTQNNENFSAASRDLARACLRLVETLPAEAVIRPRPDPRSFRTEAFVSVLVSQFIRLYQEIPTSSEGGAAGSFHEYVEELAKAGVLPAADARRVVRAFHDVPRPNMDTYR